ncbi:hypothetical protein BHU72_12910 [Desulfuribacillus stibiiarsenatis]|uniref:DUF2232 domain-containing protein n=1 Tax=Desulfuribacillus stibiiarsenatis TaxID=1390249 RepID=A0A1E5L942_9FIRM|nr:DUF2232 domain-containing protein [Desulfuribacillus stibiiarsenatis]OEH86509.1 hypothetical protein BHU72_12910 [Desulfuribacillus stibiiarsenatis]
MDKQQQLRGMIEGAILSAVWVILLFLTLYTPLALVGVVILPLPFTILTYRKGLYTAGITAIVAIVLALVFNLLVIGFILILNSIIVGIVTGYFIRERKQPGVIFLAISLSILASNLLSLALLSAVTNYNLITDLSNTLKESMALSESIFAGLGVSAVLTEANIDEMVHMVRILLPSILIAISVITAYAYYHIVSYVLKKLQVRIAKLPPIQDFQLPKKVLYSYFFATIGIIFFMLTGSTDHFMYSLLINIVQILSLALAVQGIGLLLYYMNRKGWPKILRIPILILCLHPILLQIMTWVGMFDILFNWRKLPK